MELLLATERRLEARRERSRPRGIHNTLEEINMRWALLLGLMLLVGCNAMLTEDQARTICDEAGASDESFDRGVDLAEEDKAEGLSASESRELFAGDCDDDCGTDEECFSACTTCANAIVSHVYSE
jgi:hypothetical protein